MSRAVGSGAGSSLLLINKPLCAFVPFVTLEKFEETNGIVTLRGEMANP